MKRALAILLLMLTLTLLGGVGRAADAGASPLVSPAPLGIGDRLELYSYSFLGVEVRNFTEEEFAELQARLAPVPATEEEAERRVEGEPAFLSKNQCVLITRVIPGSPAEEAGIEEGEVLFSIEGTYIKNPAKLVSVMRNYQPGLPLEKTLLIDHELRWKYVEPRPVARREPAHVGHIILRRHCPKHLAELKRRQARLIQLLAREPVDIMDSCEEMEQLSRVLYLGYTPGCLRIPLRSGECSITATRNGYNIEVSMVENGVETQSTLTMYHYLNPEQTLNYVLPESIRQRLREIDTSAAPPAPDQKH